MRRLAGTVSLLAWLTASVAAAQPSANETALARQAYQQGEQAAAEERWDDAREAFGRAYRLVERPGILLNLGAAQAMSGHLVEAAESYRRFLREMIGGEERHEEIARASLDNLLPRIPHVQLTVTNVIETDALLLDGRELSRAALDAPLPVNPGAHRITVVRDAEEVAEASFEIEEAASLEVGLEAPEPPPPEERVDLGLDRPLPNQPPESTTVWESPWFWTAVGVTVAAAVAVVVILAVTSGDGEQLAGNIPPGRITVGD